jgi:hypothetical protein
VTNSDDSQRINMQNQGIRKPMMNEKYPEKNPNYSPSISYNYSPQSSYNGSSQMHPRRRNDRFRRDPVNSNDRIIRQNDIIIRLLKEIRDRLPAPQYAEHSEGDFSDQPSDQPIESANASESWEKDENTGESISEKPEELPDQDA